MISGVDSIKRVIRLKHSRECSERQGKSSIIRTYTHSAGQRIEIAPDRSGGSRPQIRYRGHSIHTFFKAAIRANCAARVSRIAVGRS